MSVFDGEPCAQAAYKSLEMKKDSLPEELHPYQEAFQSLEESFLKTQFPEHGVECGAASAKIVKAQKELARHVADIHPDLVT